MANSEPELAATAWPATVDIAGTIKYGEWETGSTAHEGRDIYQDASK